MGNRPGKWSSLALVLLTVFLLGTQSRVSADTLELRALVNGSLLLSVVDNGPEDNNPAIGVIGVGTTTTPVIVGGLQVFGSLTTSNAPGSANFAQLASQSLNIINTSGATVQVSVQYTDTNFVLPSSPLMLNATASGTFSPVAGTGNTTVDGSTVRSRAWADNTNTSFGTQFLVQDFTTSAVAGQPLLSYSNSASQGGFSFTNPPGYSMTLGVDFTLPNNVQLNGRSNVIQAFSTAEPIPEPATMLLFGTGLAGIGAAVRKRRKTE